MAVGGLAPEVLSLAADLASFGIDPRVILSAELDSIDLSFYVAIKNKLLKDRDERDQNLAIRIANVLGQSMSG